MAQGDVVFFDQFLVDSMEKVHNLESDTIKLALVDDTTTPATTTAVPCWGSGGTTNFSSNEVTAGGNYSAGGAACANPTVALSGGAATFDTDDPATWSQHASNPTDARWGILYNDTATNKNAIGYVDLGSAFNMTTGDLTVAWGAPLATFDQA